MRHQVAVTLGILFTLAARPSIGTAQSVADSGSVETQDTTPKKGGLWGKAKKVAGNKVVKAVVKTAACTMVPGGQVIAGAIDAASASSTAEAAQGAAGAAAGTTCMPGMEERREQRAPRVRPRRRDSARAEPTPPTPRWPGLARVATRIRRPWCSR